MGADPLTLGLGLSAASGIYGAISGNQANKRAQGQAEQNFQWQQQVYGDQQARQRRIEDMITPYLATSGQGIDDLVGGRGGSDFNTGQDGIMQLFRRGIGNVDQLGPNPAATAAFTDAANGNTRFDISKLFDSIKAQGLTDLGDQVASLRAGAGSLGQRFGSSIGNREALLRSRAVTGMNAAYTQAGQSAWEAAQARRLAGAQGLDQQSQQAIAARAADANTRLGYGGLIGNLLGQKNQNTVSLLGLISGMGPGQVPQQQILPQTNGYPEAFGDIGNLAMLYPFLRDLGGSRAPNLPQIGLNLPGSFWANPLGA